MLKVDHNAAAPRYRSIADAIRDAVADGRYAPGQRLPAREALACELGVSETTIRHAYRHLEEVGLVTSRQGSGTYVQPDAPTRLERNALHRIELITVIVGAPHLNDCAYDKRLIVSDILFGISQVAGCERCRFEFAEALTPELVKQLPADSAVLTCCEWAGEAWGALELLNRRGIPAAAAWWHPDPSGKPLPLPFVHKNSHQAAALACRHLVGCGYRRIGYIGQKHSGEIAYGPKFFEFTNVMHEAGLDYRAADVLEVGFGICEAYTATRQLFDTGDWPEAFFVDTDFKAMQVMQAIQDAGLNVPGDVGIIGYDDMPEAAWTDPPLTTVRSPRRAIGRRAAQMLLAWPDLAPSEQYAVLDSDLIVRSSTRPLAADPAAELSDGSALLTSDD